MKMENQFVIKAFNCEKCGRMLECRIDKKQIEELRDSQLFNFVLMHAEDHTLIVSIDGRGQIRRSRVASLSSNTVIEKDGESLGNYEILEEYNDIVEAFNDFLKKT
ncbi:MAG: hypothetical protein KGD64_00055 [Candidatus Heimdallarchaeota archaeon]|nr:hypothetical protein [Candidatus Heimdallarchaeota archaeon]